MYTRFVGLDWGLPYPMHPDERNMAVALMNLKCLGIVDCFNPHFYAYGQFPLYMGYLVVLVSKLLRINSSAITFTEATLALRLISAIGSLLLLSSLYQLTHRLTANKSKNVSVGILTVLTLAIFSPFLIQSAHFGTTETLLMLLYSEIVRISIGIQQKNRSKTWGYYGLLLGLAVATKVSALQFGLIPFIVWIKLFSKKEWIVWLKNGCTLLLTFVFFYVLASPHNVISFKEFVGSMQYELTVGSGSYKAFYTRTFEDTVPLLFQLRRVLPYALGIGSLLLGIIAFIVLSWREWSINLLRIAMLVPLLSSAFLYTKWTRFTVLSLPLAYVFIALMVDRYLSPIKNWSKLLSVIPLTVLMTLSVLSGAAYLSVYTSEDTRIQASDWIYQHVPPGATILSETANVVDVPLYLSEQQSPTMYRFTSFDFYNLDTDPQLQAQLDAALASADYISIPSRRIFKNHTCMQPSGTEVDSLVGYSINICHTREMDYPLINDYYRKLFTSGSYEKVAEFTSFPTISLFGIEIPDEQAEETWSVFDHPVIRIYKRKAPTGSL
jgi:Dolichyl-phosphate-mannose-protein mannosyltransferase